MKLLSRKLNLISITRQSLLDADYCTNCDNCGKPIINIAFVEDEEKNRFEIGLDCKKQLIDKPILLAMNNGNYDADYLIKEYKRDMNHAEKFLSMVSKPENTIEIDYLGQEVIIKDNKPHKDFDGIIGNIIYYENLGYLNKLGLGDFTKQIQQKKYA